MFRNISLWVVVLLFAHTFLFSQSTSKQFQTHSADLPVSTHEKFATFLAGEEFKSVLLLENLRPDLPITFTPSLILGASETSLAPITVPAHSTATVDINAALKGQGFSVVQGTISVRFDFNSYGAGAAVVEMSDDKHHVFLNSYAQSPEEYWNGTSYDAVVWAPQEDTEGFVSITNSSYETHVVQTTFLVSGQSEKQPDISIPGRQTRIIRINDLLARSGKAGAGIHVEYQQGSNEAYTGAILVDGQLLNRKTGFSKHIHFVDKDLGFPTGTLRTHFLLLGAQPVEDNFPTDVSFRSVAAVRNIDTVSVVVDPAVKFVNDGTLQTAALPSIKLAPGESRVIDFTAEKKAGLLPADFKQGSLALTPDTGRTSIVAELFNLGADGGYVVGPTLSTYPNRSTGSIWRTDGSFQTTIMIENTAARDDQVAVTLYSDQGTYKKTFTVAAGNLLKINLRNLQEEAVRDDQGNVLVGTSGIVSLVGSHNTQSKLVYDKIIHDTNQSDYVGLPASPCDYVSSISLFIDFSSSTQPFPVMEAYEWTISGEVDEAASGSTVSDSSVAKITNSGSGDMLNIIPPTDNTTHDVTVGPELPSVDTTFCDACSAGEVFVASTGLSVGVHFSAYKLSAVENPACIYVPSCTGKCSGSELIVPIGDSPNFFPCAPFEQCADGTIIIGGHEFCAGIAQCIGIGSPGICT